MGFSYNVNVLNQKGSPAIYTDTFANRPSPGYAGRLFVSSDTSAIYEDTGTAWTLIANVSSGAGTLQQVTTNGNTSNVGIVISAGGLSTNNLTDTALTSGSVTFAGTGGLISQDNANLFWDDTNNRLGINTNTPGNSLDVHTGGTTPVLALNNTAGSQSAISFLNTSSAKWRIGNTATNTFDIYNFTLASIAFQLSNADNRVDIDGNVFLQKSLALKTGSSNVSAAGYTLIHSLSGTGVEGVQFSLSTGGFGSLLFNSSNNRQFTFPNADGTVALTTDIPTVSGTANYIPKFTGSSAIGNSVIYQTSLNRIGIGTITPGQQFSIVPPSDLTTNTSGQFSICETTNNQNFRLNLGYYLNGAAYQSFLQSYSGGVGTVLQINPNGGNVLLGSATDDTVNKLQVTGSSKFTGTIVSESGNSGIAINSNTATTGYNIGLRVSNTTGIFLLGVEASIAGNLVTGNTAYSTNLTTVNTGDLVLGTNQIARLTIIGSTGVVKISNLAGTGSRTVLADASGNLSAPVSDQSVKQNIEPLKYGLETIMKLNAVQFEFKQDFKNYGEGLQIGAIAQEVEQIIPEAVFKTPSTGLKGIDYNQFNGIYIKAIQEQQKIIESLIQRIEVLENK